MMGASNRQQKGKEAEQRACDYLQSKGFKLLEKNYHCTYGEIDLIMQDLEDIVFVEVRSRTRKDYGHALESINQAKITKLIKTATHFLQRKNWLDKTNGRFDIVALHPTDGKMQIQWFKNAFSKDY